MASLTSCFRTHKVPKEDRAFIKKLLSDNKEAGVDNPLVASIDEAIAAYEMDRTDVVSSIEKAGGTAPEYSPDIRQTLTPQEVTEAAKEVGRKALVKAKGIHETALQLLNEDSLWRPVDRVHLQEAIANVQEDFEAWQEADAEFKQKYPSALELLEDSATSYDKMTNRLSKFLLSEVSWDKLQAVKPHLIRSGMNSYYKGSNTIKLKRDARKETKLHEVVHSITVNEMESNPELAARVDEMMDLAMEEAIRTDYMSQETASALKAMNTAQQFIAMDLNNTENRKSYGFVNRKEFLSEAFSNRDLQNLLKGIPVPGTKRSLWDTLMRFLGDALGIRGKDYSVLEEILSIVPEIANEGTVDAQGIEAEGVIDPSIRLFRGEPVDNKGPVVRSHPGVFFYGEKDKGFAEGYTRSNLDRSLKGRVKSLELSDEVESNLANLNDDKLAEHLFGYTNPTSSRGAMPDVDTVEKLRDLGNSGYTISRPDGRTEYFILPEFLEGVEYDGVDLSPDVKETNKPKRIPKTLAQRTQVMMENDLRGKPVDIVKDWIGKAADVLKDAGKGVTERLRKIDPKLVIPLRKMEFMINNSNMEAQKQIKPFIDGYRELSKEDKLMLDLTLANNKEEDIEERNRILKKGGMLGAYKKVENVLKQIHKDKGTVGLNNYKDVAHYFPRRVKDVRGLMQAIKNDPNYNVIQAQLDSLGKDATTADKEKAIEQMIHTGRFPALALLEPSSSKRRVIKRISSEWKHFYENSADALVNHIYDSSESIQSRKLFGDTHRKKLIAARDKLYNDLENEKLHGNTRKKKVSQILAIENQLEDFETEFNEGISQLLQKSAPNLNTAEADEVIRLIRGRLTQKGMRGPLSAVRNISLMSVLGSPTSAITQIGDLAFSIYKYGPSDTVKAILGDKLITPKDLDLSHSMKEFQQEGTAKWLDKVLKVSGLHFMDTFGKTTTMNAAIKNAQKMSFKEFEYKYSNITEEDLKQMHSDLKANKNTELTRFFAFNELSNLQPTNMSEMPLMYLQSGNGRIFYALKSYNIKAINTIYRESVHTWRTAKSSEDKAQAAKNLGKLVMTMAIAGATADELKDLLLRKESKGFKDNVHENLLKIGLMSRYTLDQGWSKGMFNTLLKDVLMPPTGFIDDPLSDVYNMIADEEATVGSIQNLPWGKLPYNWFTKEAKDRNKSNLRKSIFDKVKAGDSVSSIRKDMYRYNKWARVNDKTLITYNSLQRAKRKANES